MKNHLSNPPKITGDIFKCGTGTYLLNKSYGDYRLHAIHGSTPSEKADKVAKELDDIISYLASAEMMTIQAVEEAYHGFEMA